MRTARHFLSKTTISQQFEVSMRNSGGETACARQASLRLGTSEALRECANESRLFPTSYVSPCAS